MVCSVSFVMWFLLGRGVKRGDGGVGWISWLIVFCTGSLVPCCADEAKTLIPSLAGKLSDEDLEDLCRQLERLKFQAQQR